MLFGQLSNRSAPTLKSSNQIASSDHVSHTLGALDLVSFRRLDSYTYTWLSLWDFLASLLPQSLLQTMSLSRACARVCQLRPGVLAALNIPRGPGRATGPQSRGFFNLGVGSGKSQSKVLSSPEDGIAELQGECSSGRQKG